MNCVFAGSLATLGRQELNAPATKSIKTNEICLTLLNVNNFQIKCQDGILRDVGTPCPASIGQGGGDEHGHFGSFVHQFQRLMPTLDDRTASYRYFIRQVSSTLTVHIFFFGDIFDIGIEIFAIQQVTRVVHLRGLTFLCIFSLTWFSYCITKAGGGLEDGDIFLLQISVNEHGVLAQLLLLLFKGLLVLFGHKVCPEFFKLDAVQHLFHHDTKRKSLGGIYFWRNRLTE